MDEAIQKMKAAMKPVTLEEKLDRIYDTVDTLIKEEKFYELNLWVRTYPTYQREIDLLMGLLTATLSVKDKLPGRIVLYKEIERELKLRGELEDNPLKGLE
jgi:hypothetical protein